MCRPTRRKPCAETTRAGCGRHIDQVKHSVPGSNRCRCRTRAADDTPARHTWLSRVLGR